MDRLLRMCGVLAVVLGIGAWSSLALAAEDPPARGEQPAAGHSAAPASGHAGPAEDPHAAGGGEHEVSPFAGGIGNGILTLLIFGTVVVILGNKAWPVLIRTLDERESTIRASLEDARRERLEAEKLLVQYREQLAKARDEATAIVEEGRRDAEAVRHRVNGEARAESEAMIARAKREIQLATDAAVKSLYDETAGLAVQIAGSVLRKELSADEHRRLVAESLERMKSETAGRMN